MKKTVSASGSVPMLRLDAHQSFRPPAQNPEWFEKILTRNRFEGSIYVPEEGEVEEALALARRFPFIKRVVPRVGPENDFRVPRDPLVTSVRLDDPSTKKMQSNSVAIETDSIYWPFPVTRKVALIGLPEGEWFPPEVYIKLTGFTLPVESVKVERLRRLLRHPGPERLMFASGWPRNGVTWKSALAGFTQAVGPQSPEVREQVLGRTACEFYEIR
jgi:hypothetical protein